VNEPSSNLRPPRSDEDWAAYHAIRCEAIFALLLPGQRYREDDPDEHLPGRLPHVLAHGDRIIGTVRIDLIDATRAGFRLIGIRSDAQGRGHGTTLLALAEQAARRLGRSEITINAHPRSLGFYLANGYVHGDWRDVGPVPAGLVRVGKRMA